jgi:hypothetical protein
LLLRWVKKILRMKYSLTVDLWCLWCIIIVARAISHHPRPFEVSIVDSHVFGCSEISKVSQRHFSFQNLYTSRL